MLSIGLSLLIFVSQADAGKKEAEVEKQVPDETEVLECSGATGTSGRITDTNRGITLDLGSSPAAGAATLEHKLDIDAHEDRCITDIKVTSHIDETGCEVLLHYRSTPDQPGLHLVAAHLVADSFCPGWDDSVEVTYAWLPGRAAPTLSLSKQSIDERTARQSCVDISAQVSGDLLTVADGRKVTLKFDEMLVQGSFLSTGDTQGVCGVAKEVAVATGIRNTASLQLGLGSMKGTSSTTIGAHYALSNGKKAAFTFLLGNNSPTDSLIVMLGGQSFVYGKFTQGAYIDYSFGAILADSTIAVASLKGGYKYTLAPAVSLEAKLGVTSYVPVSSPGNQATGVEFGIGAGWSF